MPTLADQIAPKPKQPSGLGGWLASIGDEMAGAFARYGRRSGAQRDASLALLNQASAPGTDPIMGAGQKLLGLAGLITHPLAFFPTREEWDQRLQAAGNDGRMSRSIGGFLSDLPSLIDPQMAAGGAVLATAPLAAKMLNKADDVADAGIIAYHGSPHSFDKFDMSKIGTGEGAQAYGHGLYFAEAEDVAKSYRDALAPHGQLKTSSGIIDTNSITDPVQRTASMALMRDSQPHNAKYIAGNWSLPDGVTREQVNAAIDELASKSAAPAGNMYQVKINVKPDELLDWDKPLSEQPKKVADVLRDMDPKLFETDTWASRLDGAKTKGRTLTYGPENRNGEVAVRTFEENFGGAAAVAERLKAAGVKGIRYKDAGSRGGEGGTYNYVIFDDKLITILKKYGIPMTAGAGGAMMVAGQDMPPEFASQMGGT